MMFYSTRNKSIRVSLRDAILNGIAADGGLFMPEEIKPLPSSWFRSAPGSLKEIGFDVIHHLVGDEIPSGQLRSIVESTLSFDVGLVPLGNQTWALELFHGPTLAFKDFGARFLAGLTEYYAKGLNKEIVVLAATSGDTGSAVANGFLNKKGIRVIVLYPSGKVSPLQEKQLTTLGGNITAWEVDGTFDDCQRLVKQMFLDSELRKRFLLTSANSINIGRLLPQTLYYFYAWKKVGQDSDIIFSVPSGNFGNLTAGVIARRLGLPVHKFLAATNINDVVPSYLAGADYLPRPSISTISNAMDVGDPSNFIRLLDLYNGSRERMTDDIAGYRFSDPQTKAAMVKVLKEYGYFLDPHGAVAYLALLKFREESGGARAGVFLETAHPAKFFEVVESTVGRALELPESLKSLHAMEKISTRVSARFEDARELLLRTAS